MSKVTVTIDDGGMDQAVNDAALECIEAGVVHRLSILPTGTSVSGACAMAMEHGIQVSVHLDCCRGPFLLEASSFPGTPAAWWAAAGKLAPAVRSEWSCQIERLLAEGAMVTCADSHRHLHHLPRLREVFLEIAEEYGIGTVRAAVLPDRMSRFPAGLILDRLGRRLRKAARDRGLHGASVMLGFGACGSLSRGYLRKHLPEQGAVEAELVTHPATRAVWSRRQPLELEFMLSEWFAEWIR